MNSEVATRVEEALEGKGVGLKGALSLKLLTWPHAGKIREVSLKMAGRQPSWRLSSICQR